MTERHDESQAKRRPPRLLLRPRPTEEQKRAFERTTTHREVPVHTPVGDEWNSARLVNVSPSGLQLGLDYSLPIDAEVEVEVEVFPGRHLPAVVRWVKADPAGGFHVGAEWRQELPIDEVWQIRAYESAD